MRILVHEFFSGGGLAGRDAPLSLVREGSAMRRALVADLAAIGCHEVVATVDPRFPLIAPTGVEVATLSPRSRATSSASLDALIASADAVWFVAPETGRCLERLAVKAEQKGTAILGSGAAAIGRAADKAALPRRLAGCGVAHPKTRILRLRTDWEMAARDIGYPVVVKPGRGAGCEGVSLACNARELRDAVRVARTANGKAPLLMQHYVRGIAASVSLLADGRRAVALTVNRQLVRASRRFAYRGGRTPLDHPLAERAVDAAVRVCQSLPGLRGYVGVDIVLTRSEAVVIEVNPRLTTAYLGVRRAIEGNVAAMALAACVGSLPPPPRARRRVRFTASGRIVSMSTI